MSVSLFLLFLSFQITYSGKTINVSKNYSVPSPLILATSNNVLYASSWEPNNLTACSSKAIYKFNLTQTVAIRQQLNVVFCLECTCICGIAVDDTDGSIFISDMITFYLYHLDKNGRLINQNFLNLYPAVINKIGSDGRLYVTTIGSPFELNVYTKSLTLVSSYPLPPGPNYLSATIDSKSNLYVQSNEEKVLSVYDKSGKLLNSIDVGIKPESIFADEMDKILVSGVSDNGDKVVKVIVNGTVTKSVKINGGSVGGITAANRKFFVAQFNKNAIESYDY